MGQITTRRSNVSWGVTREDFLAEEALPLAFSGKQTALSEIRESAAGWLRMALEAGTLTVIWTQGKLWAQTLPRTLPLLLHSKAPCS